MFKVTHSSGFTCGYLDLTCEQDAAPHEWHHERGHQQGHFKITRPCPTTLGNIDMSPQGHSWTHGYIHVWAGFAQPRPSAHTLPARVGNWAKGPGRAEGTRMRWTRGLTREGWGRPLEKGRGFGLNSWAPRPQLASPSRRRVEDPAGCSRRAGGWKEKARTEPRGTLAERVGQGWRGPETREGPVYVGVSESPPSTPPG